MSMFCETYHGLILKSVLLTFREFFPKLSNCVTPTFYVPLKCLLMSSSVSKQFIKIQLQSVSDPYKALDVGGLRLKRYLLYFQLDGPHVCPGCRLPA